ncbi:hypothetical protein GCM10011519_10870 [Marmoricola endophyticus]|uniref:Glycosyltransferase n=1 Tax=Marmoricola endophyticus TaxID=2040280 RepID=A0A917BGQ5_9ACTN|nr:glycosyltransferase family 4 protein [Marmoricola endophyticus]GGF39078.1 hypothetical protein GCM10011519_10870 [Marmoricola endophyticus]
MTSVTGQWVLLCSGDDRSVDDVRAAHGLADALVARGHTVRVLEPARWLEADGADVVVVTTPAAEPSYAANAWRIAWVGEQVERWAAAPHLPAYDQVLATSPLSAERLRRATDRAGEVLMRGCDPGATGAGPADPAPDEDAARGTGHLSCAWLASVAAGETPETAGRLGLRAAGLLGLDADERRRTVRERHAWARRAEEIVRLVEAGRGRGPAPRHPVHFWPDYTSGNPIQSMMYAALGDVDAYPVAVPGTLADWLERRTPRAQGLVLHLHWTAPILQNCRSAVDALVALRRTLTALEGYVGAGGRMAWTIHNVLPHDVKWRWAELELAQWLADHAERVHVMAPVTVREARPFYVVDPARVVQVDLSSYEGVYPRWIGRQEARRRLGLEPHHRVLTAVGGIRAYKGLNRMLDVFAAMAAEDPDLRLLVAGQPSGDGIEELRERCEADPRVVARFGFVADADLQVWMHAADLAVLPYRAILNSAAFTLAHTFGLPVVGPAAGGLLEWDHVDHVRLFDPADDGSLEETLRTAVTDLVVDETRAARAHEAARAASLRLHPDRMADGLAEMIGSLVVG